MDASRNGVTVIKDNGILIEKDVPIPLADGHVIYCNVFRPDRIRPGLTQEQALSGAPASELGRFQVPRILGEEA